MVAAGILLSRIIGLIRNRVFAHYFGTSAAADAFNAAFRIPNFLQNLFGEGVLSASLIPVYAGLRAGGRTREAAAVATAVASLLGLVVSLLVLAGVLLAPWLIDLIAPGFEGEKRELTVRLVRILFPGAGLLALSAWCLGVLNSHRLFFLSYVAPVLWNAAIIVALVLFGNRRTQPDLAVVAAWGSVAGSLLQLLFQLPTVLRVLDGLRPGPLLGPGSRTVLRNFGPVFVGRGVVQISAYVDTFLASLLPTGAVAAVSYAQVLYTLPVSLFGMSVSAAELPEMSSATGTGEERASHLRARLDSGLRQIAFLVVPSVVGFVALGDVVTGALYQSGEFTREMTLYVWGILAAAAVGLLPSTLGGSTPPRSTPCTTPARRSGSHSYACRWACCSAISSRCTCRRRSGSARSGERPVSPWRRGLRRGWSTSCCGERSPDASGARACPVAWSGASGWRPGWREPQGGCCARRCRRCTPSRWRLWCFSRSAWCISGWGRQPGCRKREPSSGGCCPEGRRSPVGRIGRR